MITFAKSQASAAIASFVDYCITVFLKEIVGAWYVYANAFGATAGGIINFYINRSFVFSHGVRSRNTQLLRYLLVWTGYLLLTSAGIFLLTHYFRINYIVSKVIVSLGLAVGYNYPLQKRFVFR